MRADGGRRGGIAAALATLLALAGCAALPTLPRTAPTPPTLALTAVGFAALPGWDADHLAAALPAFLAGCRQLPEAAAAALGGPSAQWQPACTAAARLAPGDDAAARAFFEAYFRPYAVGNAKAPAGTRTDALFTGYFDPEVPGSRTEGGRYRSPLLGRPPDLVQVDLAPFNPDLKGSSIAGRVQDGRLVPYYDRAEIDAGVLARRRLELLWLADPVDVFVLQVQGSGRVDLPDGHVVRVTYAGQNGRPYVPIGRVLADRGQIPLAQVSLATIRTWLEQHPAQAAEVMAQNPSYVFFREVNDLQPDEGPPGALGVPLVPGRSIAVDRAFIPLGAPVFIATTDPLTGTPLQRLMLAQDIGGAIKGPTRADIFFGWGHAAGQRAGEMRAHGREYLLLPRPAASAPGP